MPRALSVLLAFGAAALAGCGAGDSGATGPTAASHRYFGDHPG